MGWSKSDVTKLRLDWRPSERSSRLTISTHSLIVEYPSEDRYVTSLSTDTISRWYSIFCSYGMLSKSLHIPSMSHQFDHGCQFDGRLLTFQVGSLFNLDARIVLRLLDESRGTDLES